MRELFVIDKKNYIENGTVGKRPSVRGIIIRDNTIAMMHSLKYDYYKLPGGGIEEGESLEETIILDLNLTLFSTFFLHSPKHKLYIIISFNRHIVSDARDTSAGRGNTLITGSKRAQRVPPPD